jgi:hypothetical protein
MASAPPTATPSATSASAPTSQGVPANFDYTKHIVGAGTPEDPYTFTDPFTGNTYYFNNTEQKWIVMVCKRAHVVSELSNHASYNFIHVFFRNCSLRLS